MCDECFPRCSFSFFYNNLTVIIYTEICIIMQNENDDVSPYLFIYRCDLLNLDRELINGIYPNITITMIIMMIGDRLKTRGSN